MNTWSKLYDCSVSDVKLDLSMVQRFRRDLPYEWWAPISSDMLLLLWRLIYIYYEMPF